MIVFQNKKISPTFQNQKIVSWLENSAKEEGKNVGEIVYLFCNDDFLLKYNIRYLGHKSLTDVISFDYSEDKIISGDILISVDRIKENSLIFGVEPIEELKRVMLHGLLHLIGFKDKTQKEKKIMREKEDYYLKKFNLNNQ
tara:strand:+ start:43 stop:465 length:423 start_codon:yes stop_codon:yes gene_type:complete